MNDDEARALIEALGARARVHRTEAAAGTIIWREWGKGPPVVLLHGGSGSWTHWVRSIPTFSEHHRVLAADLPGCGDSPSPAEPYDVPSLAAIVSAGIDVLVPASQPIDVVGFSFGGILGAEVATQRGKRVRSLTVAGSPAYGIPPSGPANEVRAVSPELSLAEAEALHRYNLRTLMLADDASVDALAVRVHHDNLRRTRLRSRKMARNDNLAKTLRRVGCRLHGIWGERDVTVHPDLETLERLFLEAAADNRFDVIENAGHWVMYESPERFNALVSETVNADG